MNKICLISDRISYSTMIVAVRCRIYCRKFVWPRVSSVLLTAVAEMIFGLNRNISDNPRRIHINMNFRATKFWKFRPEDCLLWKAPGIPWNANKLSSGAIHDGLPSSDVAECTKCPK